MASLTDSFPQFSNLPPELRDHIWGFAFPEARVYEVFDSPPGTPVKAGPSAKLRFADFQNEPPPALARVCRDSRQAVLRHYKPLVFSGVVKHVNLRHDIILLDSYLQVRRLLKVVRLLSQIESVRRFVSRIALGTSWGLQVGFHHRILSKAVRTNPNMARLLVYLSKFIKLDAIILVVFQHSTSASEPSFFESNLLNIPRGRQDLHDVYAHFSVNPDIDYWQRIPYPVKLVPYEPEVQKIEKPSGSPRGSKSCHRDPQPKNYYNIRELKRTFEKAFRKAAADGRFFPTGPHEPPKLETATVLWDLYRVRRFKSPWTIDG